MPEHRSDPDLLALTAEIVAAYVGHNAISPTNLLAAIHGVYSALRQLGEPPAEAPEGKRLPAVPIKRSITPDYLICLEDGRRLKSLRRHLKEVYGLTPEGYRARWGLPHHYPMVAPNYSTMRSTLAKKMRLGSKHGSGSAPSGEG